MDADQARLAEQASARAEVRQRDLAQRESERASQYVAPTSRPRASLGVTTSYGEVFMPSGTGFVGTRDGTYYAPSGPNGVIDTRTGQYIPVNPINR